MIEADVLVVKRDKNGQFVPIKCSKENFLDWLNLNPCKEQEEQPEEPRERYLKIQMVNGNCASYSSRSAEWEICRDCIKVKTNKSTTYYVVNNIIQFSES